jgi:hypothetical protein
VTRPIQPGDPVEVRDFHGNWLPAVARSSLEPTHVNSRKIHDFPVIRVELPDRPDWMPWPAEAVRHPQSD